MYVVGFVVQGWDGCAKRPCFTGAPIISIIRILKYTITCLTDNKKAALLGGFLTNFGFLSKPYPTANVSLSTIIRTTRRLIRIRLEMKMFIKKLPKK
jgi:hypothetical protein